MYNFLEEYKPQQESLKFFAWNNMMFDKDTHMTPKMHYILVDEMLTHHRKFVAEMFRGSAKTTNMSHKMPLYAAMLGRLPNFGSVNNAVLISDTFEQADTQLQSCMSYYESSDKLQTVLNLEKRKEGMLLFANNRGEKFHISARGAGQSFRGTNYGGQRPQWIIGDDLQGDEILTNKDAAQKLIKWWVGTVLQAVDISRFKITVIGTPMIENDLISSLMRNQEYNKVRFPVAQEFSTNPDKIISAWADRFTPKDIISMYNDAKSLGVEGEFFREMFLEIANEETQIFKNDWFKYYEYKELMRNRHKYNFFTAMDLAVSKKESADRSVIMTIAVNGDGHWFIVGLDVGRFNPSEVIDKLFAQVRKFKPLEVRAEKAALQQVLNHFIENKMLKENTHFLLNPLENNSTQKKEYRILGLQPKLKARMIHFPKDILHDEIMLLEKELLGQTRETNTTGHDDIIDDLANFNDPNFVISASDYPEEYSMQQMSNNIIDPTVF